MPAPTFTPHDAEKIDHLIKRVSKWRLSAGLTIPEVLTALRYSCDSSESFQAAAAWADTAVGLYREFYAAQEVGGVKVTVLDGIAQGFGYKGYSDAPDRDKAVIRNIAENVK